MQARVHLQALRFRLVAPGVAECLLASRTDFRNIGVSSSLSSTAPIRGRFFTRAGFAEDAFN
jgi:hypothetical protein